VLVRSLTKAESNEAEPRMQDAHPSRAAGICTGKGEGESVCLTSVGLGSEYAKSQSVESVVHDTMSLVGQNN
jgi:hypothetical protein